MVFRAWEYILSNCEISYLCGFSLSAHENTHSDYNWLFGSWFFRESAVLATGNLLRNGHQL